MTDDIYYALAKKCEHCNGLLEELNSMIFYCANCKMYFEVTAGGLSDVTEFYIDEIMDDYPFKRYNRKTQGGYK